MFRAFGLLIVALIVLGCTMGPIFALEYVLNQFGYGMLEGVFFALMSLSSFITFIITGAVHKGLGDSPVKNRPIKGPLNRSNY